MEMKLFKMLMPLCLLLQLEPASGQDTPPLFPGMQCSVEVSKPRTVVDFRLLYVGSGTKVRVADNIWVEVNLFPNEIVFTEMRTPTESEQKDFYKVPGPHARLAGMILAESRARADGQVALADFKTENVRIRCHR